jgi:predicted dehydrogenase
MATEFMKVGKFVFVEKPITATLEDCEELIAQMKKYNGRTAVAFNKRRWPAVTFARNLVKEGAIGKPLIYNGRYTQGFLLEVFPYSFRSERNKGGGFADSGSHVLDMARFILDDKYDEVVGLAEVLDHEVPEYPKDGGAPIMRKKDAEDLALVIAKMKSGVRVTAYQTYKYGGAFEDISFEVIGTKGTLRWSGANPSEFQMFQAGEDKVTNGFRSVIMGPAHPYGQAVPPLPGFGVGVVDNMSFQAYEVINAFVNNTKFSPDFEDAYEIAKVCEAVRESTKTKAWVKLD